jgi:DNA transformation protein
MPRRRATPDSVDAQAGDSMREWLEDALRELPRFEIRRLFGGAGLYARGVMFGIFYKARVYLKTDDATRPEYVSRGMDAFRVRQGTVLTKYYEVPEAVLADEGELLAWSRRAIQVAEATPRTATRRKKRPTRRQG